MPEIYTNTTLDQFNKHIGDFLRSVRREKGLTLEDVIYKSGLRVTTSSLSNIEQGRQRISAYQLFQLSEALDFSVDKLFGKAMSKSRNEDAHFNVSTSTKELINKL